MYHIYSELIDNQGNIIHKTPRAKADTLGNAITYATVWNNGKPMGIYKINADGSETKAWGM